MAALKDAAEIPGSPGRRHRLRRQQKKLSNLPHLHYGRQNHCAPPNHGNLGAMTVSPSQGNPEAAAALITIEWPNVGRDVMRSVSTKTLRWLCSRFGMAPKPMGTCSLLSTPADSVKTVITSSPEAESRAPSGRPRVVLCQRLDARLPVYAGFLYAEITSVEDGPDKRWAERMNEPGSRPAWNIFRTHDIDAPGLAKRPRDSRCGLATGARGACIGPMSRKGDRSWQA